MGGNGKMNVNPQQTHNSFGLSNVSTNINNPSNNYNQKSAYSTNKQAQSSNSTGYNFGNGNTSQNAYSNVGQNRSLKNQVNGPIKAKAIGNQDFMQTIQVEENTKQQVNSQFTRRTQKPPISKAGGGSMPPGANVTSNSAGGIPRAYSVNAGDQGNTYNLTIKS